MMFYHFDLHIAPCRILEMKDCLTIIHRMYKYMCLSTLALSECSFHLCSADVCSFFNSTSSYTYLKGLHQEFDFSKIKRNMCWGTNPTILLSRTELQELAGHGRKEKGSIIKACISQHILIHT